MCIVIDTNTIGLVFNQHAQDHIKFEPVFDWILNGKGKIVWGGTTYKNELKDGKYLNLFTLLSNKRKTVKINTEKVDEIETQLKINCQGSKFHGFNDHHIVAIIRASGCNIICTKDKKADRFLKCQLLYPSCVEVPKIYRGIKKHRHLINDNYIVGECLPGEKLKKEDREVIEQEFKKLNLK